MTITETLTTQQLNCLKALMADEISFQGPNLYLLVEDWILRKIIIMWLSVSGPFLYLFSPKIGIFHKFLYLIFWYSRNYTYFYFPKWRYKPIMVLKITNLHILRHLPTCWLYLLERYTIDNQRCTHTASESDFCKEKHTICKYCS